MSSDIYIPLSIVLSHPGQFRFQTDYNVDEETAVLEAARENPDWEYVASCLQTVLRCNIGSRQSTFELLRRYGG